MASTSDTSTTEKQLCLRRPQGLWGRQQAHIHSLQFISSGTAARSAPTRWKQFEAGALFDAGAGAETAHGPWPVALDPAGRRCGCWVGWSGDLGYRVQGRTTGKLHSVRSGCWPGLAAGWAISAEGAA